MEELLNILSEKDLNQILSTSPEIKGLTKEEVLEKIVILRKYNCTDLQVQNIITMNPDYLNKLTEHVLALLQKLKELGFEDLNFLIDSNPFILDKNSFEIEDYIEREKNNNKKLKEVVEELSEDPFLFNEI